MAQGREGRAVLVKWAQEKDQPPTAERSESRKKEEAKRSREGARCSRQAHRRGGMRQIRKQHRNPGRHVSFFKLNMNCKKQANLIGNVKASCFTSFALNLHRESAHSIANKKHPSPNAARCNLCLAGSCFK